MVDCQSVATSSVQQVQVHRNFWLFRFFQGIQLVFTSYCRLYNNGGQHGHLVADFAQHNRLVFILRLRLVDDVGRKTCRQLGVETDIHRSPVAALVSIPAVGTHLQFEVAFQLASQPVSTPAIGILKLFQQQTFALAGQGIAALVLRQFVGGILHVDSHQFTGG